MASLDDILTTQKNGVVAINNLAQILSYMSYVYIADPSPVVQSTTSASVIYTVPNTLQYTVTGIDICNTSGSADTFTICFVPSGGTADATNAIYYSAPIAAHTTISYRGGTALDSNYTIQAFAGTTNLTFKIAGASN
jgi:hypothetical protein